MMLFEYQLMPVSEQVAILYKEGVYVGKRKVGNKTMLLYQLDCYYVEVVYNKYRHFISKIRSSANTSLLDPYLEQIDVDNLLTVGSR